METYDRLTEKRKEKIDLNIGGNTDER